MTFNRLLAKFIDLLVVAAFAAVPTWVGKAAGLTYALIADGLGGGQSLGKRIVGLRVLGQKGAPCTFLESVRRNLSVGVALALLFVGAAAIGAAGWGDLGTREVHGQLRGLVGLDWRLGVVSLFGALELGGGVVQAVDSGLHQSWISFSSVARMR